MLYFAATDENMDTGWDRDLVVFNINGGHYRTHRQCPPGGLPLTSSSASVVDANGPTGSASQGARHRRLPQPRWCTLPDPPTASPGGPPSMSSSTSVVNAVGPTSSAPQGDHHRRLLQPRWWKPGWTSDNIPRCIFESYPRDCHPIAFLSTLRSFSDW
jgi:hypothetical protein